MICLYCKAPRTSHGPFARCSDGRTQFLSQDGFDKVMEPLERSNMNREYVEEELCRIIQLELLEIPLRAKACRAWLTLRDMDIPDDKTDEELCQWTYNVQESMAFPD